MDTKSHWEKVYRTKRPNEVSWYRPHLEISLQLIEDAAPNHNAQIIDVGAGESTLVDDLMAREYRNVYVLDVSSMALEVAKGRLGASANQVACLCGDVTTFGFSRYQFDVWHDRAVFHFCQWLPMKIRERRFRCSTVSNVKGNGFVAAFLRDRVSGIASLWTARLLKGLGQIAQALG